MGIGLALLIFTQMPPWACGCSLLVSILAVYLFRKDIQRRKEAVRLKEQKSQLVKPRKLRYNYSNIKNTKLPMGKRGVTKQWTRKP